MCLCGLLLVFNSNLGRILHRFGDTAAYRSKNRQNRPFEPTQSHKSPSLGVTPCEFFDESYLAEAEFIRLSDGKEIMTLALSVYTIPAVTDTDTSLSQRPALRIASHE